MNTGAKAMVRFGRGSGRWLRSTQGERFAMADQSISQNGRRGGAYVIAAKLGTDRSVPCAGISELRASASDTASVSADSTLPASGYMETALSSRNANGRLLENYGPLEICINTPTHPDGAKQTRHPAADSWCYQGRGAYLNDPNGAERYSPEAGGGYIGDSYHRHYIAYNGAIVAAAKRPSLNPVTGRVLPNTPIVWRIYAPKVLTTNGFGF